MTKQELIDELNKIKDNSDSWDIEGDHISADSLLIKFIDDAKVTTAYNSIRKLYA